MGVKVGRIVKEYLFKGLAEQQLQVKIHGHRQELLGSTLEVEKDRLRVAVTGGDPAPFRKGDAIRVYFLYHESWHTFSSRVLDSSEGVLTIESPEGVYKNPQRKYERVRLGEEVELYFTLKGQRVDLNFPRTSRPAPADTPLAGRQDFDLTSLDKLYAAFRERMKKAVSSSRIVMLRDKRPESYEEKLIAELGKMLWIPLTEEGWPTQDPFPDERVVLRRDLVKYEEGLDRPAYVITSKLGNILYEKQKRNIHAELWCPVQYESYVIGYVYLANREERKERIGKELADYVWEFAKVLSYSLQLNGYFAAPTAVSERRYESPVIDISAAGLLFAHPRLELARELLIHTDLEVTVRFPERRIVIQARVRRKFQDNERSYFGLQFLSLDAEDKAFLFQKLYGRPYTSSEEDRWEGGTPPPPLDLFGS